MRPATSSRRPGANRQQKLFGFNPGVTILIEFDHVEKRPSKPATPGDKRASEALPIFEGSEVNLETQFHATSAGGLAISMWA